MLAPRPLFARLIDYAGLFPPAQRTMTSAIERYAAHRRGPHSWMLGRFIVPVGRLPEFERALDAVRGEEWGPGRWRVSVIGGRGMNGDLKTILDFNRRRSESAQPAAIEAVEVKVLSREELDAASDIASEALEVYAEVPGGIDPRPWIGAAADAGLRVKVRAGGVTPDMFPPASDLARFIAACAERKVAFKATAGLHHALRAERPVSGEPSAPIVLMHGFLNLLLAASFARSGELSVDEIKGILEERSLEAFDFSDDSITWSGQSLTASDLADIRRSFAVGYGSCSFEQPIEDLQILGLLER